MEHGGSPRDMSMLVVDYLEHRSQKRAPPPEFIGLPEDSIPIIVATGASGNYNLITALLDGLKPAGQEFIRKVLVPSLLGTN